MFDNAESWGETPPFYVPVFVLTHGERVRVIDSPAVTHLKFRPV